MELGPIDVFRAGSWTDMGGTKVTFTAADLAQIAASYDPVNAPAPVVIGHPTNDAPAYAWVSTLYVEGDKLKAMLIEAKPEFVEWVKAGSYRKVSISLFPKDAPANPTPGKLQLRHVGFLGGAAPAVTGLEPVRFSTGKDGSLCFEEDSILAERNALRRERDEARLEKLIDEGRILPAQKVDILDFMDSLDSETVFSFSAGRKETPRAWFLNFLQHQPKQVDFSTLPPDDRPGAGFRRGSRLGNMPAGHHIDPAGELLFSRAVALAEKESISFAEAAFRLSSHQ